MKIDRRRLLRTCSLISVMTGTKALDREWGARQRPRCHATPWRAERAHRRIDGAGTVQLAPHQTTFSTVIVVISAPSAAIASISSGWGAWRLHTPDGQVCAEWPLLWREAACNGAFLGDARQLFQTALPLGHADPDRLGPARAREGPHTAQRQRERILIREGSKEGLSKTLHKLGRAVAEETQREVEVLWRDPLHSCKTAQSALDPFHARPCFLRKSTATNARIAPCRSTDSCSPPVTSVIAGPGHALPGASFRRAAVIHRSTPVSPAALGMNARASALGTCSARFGERAGTRTRSIRWRERISPDLTEDQPSRGVTG